MSPSKIPRCLSCGKKLRKKSWGVNAGKYGGYGDGRFCGLGCAHSWANFWLDRKPELDAALKEAMIGAMNEKEIDK